MPPRSHEWFSDYQSSLDSHSLKIQNGNQMFDENEQLFGSHDDLASAPSFLFILFQILSCMSYSIFFDRRTISASTPEYNLD